MKATRLLAVLTAIIFASCDASYLPKDPGSVGTEGDAMGPAGGEAGDPAEGNGNSLAGVVTAGEWNDLDNWQFWNALMDGQNESKSYEHLHYWGMYPYNRFSVVVVDVSKSPVCGAKVELFLNDSEQPVWTTLSDNMGSAELWYNISSDVDTEEEKVFTVSVNGKKYEQTLTPTYNTSELVNIDTLVTEQIAIRKAADIAFIVDATGSMWDEIAFLKDDLLDIIQRASSNSGTHLRTAALFYRDEGDEYVTRIENFNQDPENTLEFIKQQEASGGGDYPEAVHTALAAALQELSWEEGNYARLAFLLLDAPPHYQSEVLESIKVSIRSYAAAGIKIIPIAASGIDKNTEFLLRLMAIFTNGTYTFITNHSGVGGDHIEPTIGEYQVEQLNDLIVRLIMEYTSSN